MSIAQAVRIDVDAGSYRDEQQDHRYEHDLGLCVLPVAQSTSKHRVIRLHGGYAMRRVQWSATRVGVPPMIPAAADTTGDTILSATVVPSLPVLDKTNDSYSWAVQGEYLYVQNTPREAGKNAFPAGNHPYEVLPQSPLAAAIVTGQESNILMSANPTDTLTEYAGAHTTRREDGSIIWPFTALPAFLTSTHIIGG